MLSPGEDCDGTTVGCEFCKVKKGYKCVKKSDQDISVCTPICGDGIVISPEKCDDGGNSTNDGCNADCSAYEAGFNCL